MKEAQEDQARKAAKNQALFRDVNERIEELGRADVAPGVRLRVCRRALHRDTGAVAGGVRVDSSLAYPLSRQGGTRLSRV